MFLIIAFLGGKQRQVRTKSQAISVSFLSRCGSLLGQHVGDVEDSKAKAISQPAIALLNAAMIMLFAVGDPVFEEITDWHRDLTYRRSYPTLNEPEAKQEDLLGSVYTLDDMHRALSLLILCDNCFDEKGNFFPHSKPKGVTVNRKLARTPRTNCECRR